MEQRTMSWGSSKRFRDRWGRFFWTITRVGPDGFGNRSNDFHYGRNLMFGTDSPIVGVISSSGVADSAIVGTDGVDLLCRGRVIKEFVRWSTT